jgi:hypothetical protein
MLLQYASSPPHNFASNICSSVILSLFPLTVNQPSPLLVTHRNSESECSILFGICESGRTKKWLYNGALIPLINFRE